MTRLPGRPVLRTSDIEDYVHQIATTLVQLHRVPIDRLGFLPDQAALLSNSLSKRKLADDPARARFTPGRARRMADCLLPTVSCTTELVLAKGESAGDSAGRARMVSNRNPSGAIFESMEGKLHAG